MHAGGRGLSVTVSWRLPFATPGVTRSGVPRGAVESGKPSLDWTRDRLCVQVWQERARVHRGGGGGGAGGREDGCMNE